MDTDTVHRELENVVEILNELHVIEKIYKAKNRNGRVYKKAIKVIQDRISYYQDYKEQLEEELFTVGLI